MTVSWLIQQSLPRTKIPTFSGAPLDWVPFITKFHARIHSQEYLSDEQRSTYLLDHLDGEPKRSVTGFSHDSRGYVLSLKRLKFLFAQRTSIAQAYISQVTCGKQVPDDDTPSLSNFYYTVSDCLVALQQLSYFSDLFSSDTLRQAVRRLPYKLHMKWAEHSQRIRERNGEPSLFDLESWLQARLQAYKDACLPEKRNPKPKEGGGGSKGNGRNEKSRDNLIGVTLTKASRCVFCSGKHRISKCETFMELSAAERYAAARDKKLCFNCLNSGHSYPTCPSTKTCFAQGCEEQHHTLLHDHFTGQVDSSSEAEGKKSWVQLVTRIWCNRTS